MSDATASPETAQKDLVAIIRENPGASLHLDIGSWQLRRAETSADPCPEDDFAAEEEWAARQVLASPDDQFTNPDHAERCYGEGVLYALAEIVGITVEPA